MKSKRLRPVGIAIIGWINVVGGVLIAIAGLAPELAAAGPALVLGGCVSVALGVGLLKLRGWARLTALALYAVNSAVGLVEKNPIAALVAVMLIAYLLSPKVKDAFAASAMQRKAAAVPGTEECLAQS